MRRRVPAADVDDVVQTVLCDALSAAGRPGDPAELKRWLLGIARHKVADLHRRAHREPPLELPELEASPAPIEAHALVRWAEEQAGSSRDAQQTLGWMAREGEGEKLESIAAEEQVPAARVRQRVSRMRRWMKERWAAELAAVAVLVTVTLVAWWILRRPNEDLPEAKPDRKPVPSGGVEAPSPLEVARGLRERALEECARGAWQGCLDGLDKARGLDPDGDRDPVVGAARARAEEALRPPPAPPSAVPSALPPPAPPPERIEKSGPPRPTTTAVPKLQPTGTPFVRPTATAVPITKPTGTPFTKKGKPEAPALEFGGKAKPVGKMPAKSGDFDGK